MPPDVVLLGTGWWPRALLRAQMIEEGLEVLATDTWTMMRCYLRPGSKPRLAIVDLQGLPQPDHVLADLTVLMKPSRVMVLMALGTVPRARVEHFGFRIVQRPIRIAEVVATAERAIREESTPLRHPTRS